MPQFVFTLSPYVFHFTADLTCQVQVFLQQLVCVHGLELCVLLGRISQSLPLSLLFFLTLFLHMSLSFLSFFSLVQNTVCQAQPGATVFHTKYLVKDPTMVART